MNTEIYRPTVVLTALVAFMMMGSSCKQEPTTSGQALATASAVVPGTERAKVAKVVFVGKKDACECTRKRVDDSLAVLQTALAARPDVSVEQFQVDTDAVDVARYKALGAIVVLPAIYLLDESGGLVEMLNGEVTPAQVEALL